MTISYQNPFTGQTIQPSQVGYELLTIATNTELQWPINGNNDDVVANIIEVIASVGSLSLTLPAATQVSTGQSVLIANIGANAFTVKNYTGGTIVSIASGIAQYIYLTDNSTTAGTWSTVTFGAGTSSANAATLAGYGLTAITTTLNQSHPIVDYIGAATLSASNRAEFVNWTSGVGTITLPVASSVGNNWFAIIRNSGTGILTISPSGTDTLDDLSSQQLQLTESFVVVSNGVDGYSSFGYGQAIQFFFTFLSKVVTGGTVTLSSAEASNIIQEYSGTLLSNCNIILPPTVQLYSVNNLTTGAYNLTFKTSAGGAATYTLPQNTTALLICDGTDTYNATSASVSTVTQLTLGNGSTAAPSLRFAGDFNTGLYLPTAGQLGFVVGNAQAGYFSSTGLTVTNGISGGTF
jgi:hypothetical protein